LKRFFILEEGGGDVGLSFTLQEAQI